MNSLAILGCLEDDDIALDLAAMDIAAADRTDPDLTKYSQYLDRLSARIDHHITGSAARATHLAEILANQEGFCGDNDDYDNARNADFLSVLDSKHGLPIALAILYVALARRKGWHAHIVGMQGHVLVSIGNVADQVLLDPFHYGQLMQPDDFLHRRHATTLTNREALVRLILNQARRAQEANNTSRALTLYRRLTEIAPGYPQLWWERARLEQASHLFKEARSSLANMHEITHDPYLAQQIRSAFEMIPK